ncbi:MAG: molecular chaperone DnaJ [Pseudomonadota bacterium]
MDKQDFYEVLGVDRGADAATLKRAYRKLAMQYHPDRNPGDEAAEKQFKSVSEAYDVLKDSQKRAAYDRFGHAAFQNGGGGQGQDFSGSFSDIFDDLFGDFMGGGRRGRSTAQRGNDLRYNMEITLEEAFTGKPATIDVPTTVTCEVCDGTGAEPGTKPETCPTCQGAGKIRTQQGFFMVERTCVTCQGLGQIIKSPCRNCGGRGRIERERNLSVNIPAGVDDGTRIRLSGEGEAGARGGPPGDLYIFLSVKPHHLFERDGTQVYCRVPISMTTAALGGEVEVPTVDGGRADVKIPAGTQSGRQFRLKSKGMPHLNGHARGDMILQAEVETPVNLSRRQRELLREFDQESGGKTSPASEGFFAKVKDFFDDLTD